MQEKLLRWIVPALIASASLFPVLAHSAVPESHFTAAASQLAPATAIDDLITHYQGDMMKAARAMPPGKYGFTPATLPLPEGKFTGVRSFADQVKHVTQANYAIAANVLGTEPAVDLKRIGTLENKDAILAALEASFVAVHQAIATITPANQNDAVDDIGVAPHVTRATEAAWAAVHGYDHYGQMVEYLRMNGIVL